MEKQELRRIGGYSIIAGLFFLMTIPFNPEPDITLLDQLTLLACAILLSLGIILIIFTRRSRPWDGDEE